MQTGCRFGYWFKGRFRGRFLLNEIERHRYPSLQTQVTTTPGP
jgi:hypothetical protein